MVSVTHIYKIHAKHTILFSFQFSPLDVFHAPFEFLDDAALSC